jgi:NADP-dependent 3-hydroxy acid dehydrogenase YdfG
MEDSSMEEKKVIAVAGASSGTGKAIAERFGKNGHQVALCARREELIREIADGINRAGGKALGLKADMAVWKDAEAFVEKTVEEFGRIDVMVNNAGAAIEIKEFGDYTLEEIDRGIGVNFTSVLYGCRAVIPHMKKQKSGYIINATSILGKRSRSNLAVYSAGKHGVEGFTKSLANELRKYGIKVTVLAPAAIDTEWGKKGGMENLPPGKLLQAEDIAEMVELLIKTADHYAVWNIDFMALDQSVEPL